MSMHYNPLVIAKELAKIVVREIYRKYYRLIELFVLL